MLAGEYTLLRMFLNIWRQILSPGNLHDTALQNFCTTECGTCKCLLGLKLPTSLSNYQISTQLQDVFNLIVSKGLFTLS